jgi:hypothetical protein
MSEEKLSNNSVMRLQNWSLQQSGNLVPQGEMKTTWGIKMIYPFEEEVQQRRLHKKSQPLEQLDRVIEEIRRLMLRSTEVVNKGKMNRGEPATTTGKKKKKQQQQQ